MHWQPCWVEVGANRWARLRVQVLKRAEGELVDFAAFNEVAGDGGS